MGRTPHEGIRAQLGSVEVAAAVVYHLGARDRHTRVWARARIRPQPRFALGTRRRRLEQVALEPDILAWTDRPRHVQSRWSAGDGERWRRLQRAEAGAQRADRTCRVVSDGHLVELVIAEVITDADWLVAAMELVGRIASDDLGAAARPAGITLVRRIAGVDAAAPYR